MPIIERMPMNVYVCHSVIKVEEKGHFVIPKKEHYFKMVDLIK